MGQSFKILREIGAVTCKTMYDIWYAMWSCFKSSQFVYYNFLFVAMCCSIILLYYCPPILLSASTIPYPLNPPNITSWWLCNSEMKWQMVDFNRPLWNMKVSFSLPCPCRPRSIHWPSDAYCTKNAKHFLDLASSNLIGCLCAVLLVGCKGFLNQSNGKQSHLPKLVKLVPSKKVK